MPLKVDIEKKDPQGLARMSASERPFTKLNYYMMGGCVALIVLGFLLMSGGGSTVEGGFNPEIFSTRRIVVGPALAFIGFLLMAFAIVYQPKSQRRKQREADQALEEVAEEEVAEMASVEAPAVESDATLALETPDTDVKKD